MSKKILKIILILLILISNIGCDQISKNIVRRTISENEHIKIIDNYLTLIKVENSGAFLSFGNSFPRIIKNILLIILPLIAIGFACKYLIIKQNLSKWLIIGISFCIGGGIGNIYDRIVNGSVTDFLYINFVIFHTGIFNLGDVSIMVGMFLILCDYILKEPKNGKTT